MKLLVTAHGRVNWTNTRQTIVSSAVFSEGQDDFGAGNENTATCPGCDRTLPTVCMHLDHILSRSRHGISIATTPIAVELYDSSNPQNISQSFIATANGGTVTIYRQGSAQPSTRIMRTVRHHPTVMDTMSVLHTNDAWENDFANLQFLCMSCNTSKGGRDFDQVFNGRNTNPLG